MDTRTEAVELETTRHRIRGEVTLPASGSRSRLSDWLSAGERDFVVVTGATVTPLEGGAARHHDVLAVGRAHVVLAAPTDDA
jgi:hypothetical protein